MQLEDFCFSWDTELQGCVMFHWCESHISHMNMEPSTSGLADMIGQDLPGKLSWSHILSFGGIWLNHHLHVDN